MIAFTTYIVASFATYYLALSIASQDGPFAVFAALRGHLSDDNWIGRGIRCVVCLSCWTALVVVVGLVLLGEADAWAWPVVWFGLAGASTVIDRYWRR